MNNKEKRERVAALLEGIEKDFLAEDDEHGFAWINERVDKLAQLISVEYAGKVLLELANAHYEHSLIAQVFYTEQVAQMRRERGEL
ncbi:hypothetical protein M4D68_09705 [Priestia aryabhattai]|uniref:hypothetical protein n=1 Tax=Priestia aryabhattai TaxID=412384 RepID=UPI0020422EE4|nr:hypothetical protein [Priestia aryabhattai]MCM3641411.1 hypothetical protein [Priestia aryabhattai]